jgi:hypothetical protein
MSRTVVRHPIPALATAALVSLAIATTFSTAANTQAVTKYGRKDVGGHVGGGVDTRQLMMQTQHDPMQAKPKTPKGLATRKGPQAGGCFATTSDGVCVRWKSSGH